MRGRARAIEAFAAGSALVFAASIYVGLAIVVIAFALKIGRAILFW